MRRYRLAENRLRGMVHNIVRGVLREGYQQMMYNDEGEPIGYDYIPDPYEQEEMEWEENMHRADDPLYAASQEAEEWYQRACRVFQDQGVNVPEDVKRALAREMRWKLARSREAAAMEKMQPIADAIEDLGLGYEAYPHYEPESIDECEYYYVDVTKNGQRLSREELEDLRNRLTEMGIEGAWDYVSSGW